MMKMLRGSRALLMLFLILISCNEAPEGDKRTYRMGFQNSAPRFDDFDMFVQSLNMWGTRADAAMITTEVPWKEIFSGTDIVDYVVDNYGVVNYYRAKNFKLWVYIDPQNGLDRTADALALVAEGKSIADPDVQNVYRRFVFVMDSVLVPDHLGLALETNLIRSAAPAAIYNGVKQAANLAAQDILAVKPNANVSVSVQADHAWGRLAGGGYQGVAQDFADFPFMKELGISSYPYFGFDTPEEIPSDYYSRLVDGKDISVFISEGGWTSASVTTDTRTFTSSPELQQRYIERQAQLLSAVKAIGYFQLTFTDIDVDQLPDDVPANIAYFAYLGLVDKLFQPKPALDAWDKIFKRPLTE
ncbi:MAG TPA: hypothetical protein VIU12_07955 [Chryseolinea sp.]